MIRTVITSLCVALLTGATLAQTFTVTGVWEYEDKGWGYSGWNGNDSFKPCRLADVVVRNAVTGDILGSGSCDELGAFSIEATSIGVADINVRCNADTSNLSGFQRIRVTTEQNDEYNAFSSTFAAWDTTQDLDVGTNQILKVVSGNQEANAWNMLDMGVYVAQYLADFTDAQPSGQTIRLYWPGGSGSFASGNQAHMAQSDGYDDCVILHELGHVIQNLYSDSDSPGGSHTFGQSDQNPTLSLGEGYATFLAGFVLDHALDRTALYVDANGSSQTGGWQLRMRLETADPYSNDARGAADEGAVACTLFDILDDETSPDNLTAGTDDDLFVSTTLINGDTVHQAWWDVFTGPFAAAPQVTANDAWDGWFVEHGTGGLLPELESLFGNRRLDFLPDADEPNNSQATATPFTPGSGWSGNRTLYYSAATPASPGTGDDDFYAIDVVVGSRIDIETRYPNGASDADTQADTSIWLYDPSDNQEFVSFSGGVGRNALIDGFTIDETGTWTYKVESQSAIARRYGRYNHRVVYEFENLLPTISEVTATPDTITDDDTATLDVTASDGNGHDLTYTWTPLTGGSIVGSGDSVTFDPPAVVATTVHDIEVTATDELGAVSAVDVVQVTVNAGGSTCGAPAAVVSGGTGKAGQEGIPVLTAEGVPSVPGPAFALRMTNGLPNALTSIVLGLSLVNAPFDLGTLHPSPDVILTVLSDPQGEILLPLPVPDDAGLCGFSFYWQFLTLNDPGAAGAKQSSQTNYLQTQFGS